MQIQTEKSVVRVVGEKSGTNVGVGPGAVLFLVQNEGVSHVVQWDAQEAINQALQIIWAARDALARAGVPVLVPNVNGPPQ